MLTDVKIETGKTLHPLLSAFHEVNGLLLRSVKYNFEDQSLTTVLFDFGMKALVLTVERDYDTIDLSIVDMSNSQAIQCIEASDPDLWKGLIGNVFGWGWIIVNQQGYLDGILVSFNGVIPQLLIIVMASSIKIRRVA